MRHLGVSWATSRVATPPQGRDGRLQTIRQNLERQHFTLTAEALALHCTWYCDQGIAPILLYKRNNGLGIPYERLADHLDPDGPYRHILNN